VNVVVNNNDAIGAPATARMQAVVPAFFLNLGTSYAVASALPNYTLAGTPSAPATPGTTIVLWATGFGPTTPATAAGIEVSGAPATAATPIVTVGGTNVPVISSVLTTGSAGLYQIAIQLPANLPTGTLPIQASIGGSVTPAANIVVANQ
jgi:uncharacterized protein (TIGR03437 family)